MKSEFVIREMQKKFIEAIHNNTTEIELDMDLKTAMIISSTFLWVLRDNNGKEK